MPVASRAQVWLYPADTCTAFVIPTGFTGMDEVWR
jgi:hypothetical protein